ncbi:MAG: NAD(P)-dependent oxidoreductase [Spirochaetales bacterium]|nr:NAD(P)-dependent oxidoreductase [Spirochaetales bacterium]
MVIAVIGGSGFIGSRLVPHLLKNNRVVIIDIRESAAHPELWTYGDVRDPASMAELLRGCDCIVNLAAEHKDNISPVTRYYDVNVRGAENVCAAAEKAGVRRIVFTSSVAVYGAARRGIDESGPLRPVNHYGRSKMMAEDVYRRWQAGAPDKSLVIVRPTVVFGENNRGNVYNMLRQIWSLPYVMIGRGKNVKSMSYVENVCTFLQSLLAAPGGVETYNYADKPDFSMNALYHFVRGMRLGKRAPFMRVPYSLALLGGYLCDFAALVLRRELPVSSVRVRKFATTTLFCAERALTGGFRPSSTLREGLRRTIEHEFISPSPNAGVFESE